MTKTKRRIDKTKFNTLIPITRRFVQAPDAYTRLVIQQRTDLSAARFRPRFASHDSTLDFFPGIGEVAEIMFRIRWRAELKDDWAPAHGWGDCDSKVTRGLAELLAAGWPRGSLRIVIGLTYGDPKPIWHAVLSVWWKGAWGRKCIILDPRFRAPMNVPTAAKKCVMQYIEVPGRRRFPFALVGEMPRPRWARGIVAPVRARRTLVTLEDVFRSARA